MTYSKADCSKFKEKSNFGEAVTEVFNSGAGKVKVCYYATCLEQHQDGSDRFHTCVKLTGPKRWLSAKNYLKENFDISVHFSDEHDSYYGAYKYVVKSDTKVHLSAEHPNLNEVGSLKTKHCIKTNKGKRKSSTSETTKEDKKYTKLPRLSIYDISKFLVTNKIKTRTEVFAITHAQKQDGKEDQPNFILSCSSKALDDLIDNTWEIEAAPEKLQSAQVPRMEVIYNCAMGKCVLHCHGTWLECANQVLSQNNVCKTCC